MKNIVVFASGSGTNAENIIAHFNKTNLANVVAVFSNNPNAKALDKAKKWNVPTVVFTKEALFTAELLEKLNAFQPDLIVLAGFLLKFPPTIIASYPHKVINIHPALLPKYGGKGMYGMNVHCAVIENKETRTGITIHFVNADYDEGHIIFQKSVPLIGHETPDTVAEKVHQLELEYFPGVIAEVLNHPNQY
jgi:phosphoribosylglycinamide formyltransferase-1